MVAGSVERGEHRALVHEMYGDPRLAANALRIYRANFDTALHDPGLAALAVTSEAPAPLPLLVLAGADDGCIPPVWFEGAERGLAGGSRVEIVPGAGHFMHRERPDEIAALCLAWLLADT